MSALDYILVAACAGWLVFWLKGQFEADDARRAAMTPEEREQERDDEAW